MNLASPESTRIAHLPAALLRRSKSRGDRDGDGTRTPDELALDELTAGGQRGQDHDKGPDDGGGGGGSSAPPLLPRFDSGFSALTQSAPGTPAGLLDSRRQLLPAADADANDDDDDGNATPPRALSSSSSPPPSPPPPRPRLASTRAFLLQQARYIGPGITMSVAYCDPGNWATDLQAGSQFGYPLLFVILLTGIFGIILQVLSLRLGIVRGKDLAVSTREWALTLGMSPRAKQEWLQAAASATATPPHSSRAARRSRWALLALLYFVAEGAIVCTELAELVGSAIALNLLFPALPLWAGVLITSLDVFLILFIYRPDTKSIRLFEFCVGCLVLVVISCLIALVVKVDPYWPDVFRGYVPSATVAQPGPLYVAIGILGATVMPHGLFLGSHFSIFEREGGGEGEGGGDIEAREPTPTPTESHPSRAGKAATPPGTPPPPPRLAALREWLAATIPGVDREALGLRGSGGKTNGDEDDSRKTRPASPASRSRPPSPRRMRRRILHSTIDVAVSMVCFAITTNSALLIVAAQAFYFGIGPDEGSRGSLVVGDLFEAFALIKEKLNHVFAILFAVALLAAGQSASITVTLAGQIISEGMIQWKTNPFVRRCITRLITIVPSLVVAAAIGKSGLDEMLVASQVALSMALPFVLLPLLLLTGSEVWMRVGGGGDRDDRTDRTDREAGGVGGAGGAGDARGDNDNNDGHVGRAGPAVNTSSPLAVNTASPSPTRFSPLPHASHIARRARTFDYKQLLRRTWWTRNYGNTTRDSTAAASRAVFASGWILVGVTAAMYVLIVICDVFVIVTTANGSGGA